MHLTIILLFLCLRILCQRLPEIIFAEREEITVSNTPHIGCSSVACLIPRYVEDTDQSEVSVIMCQPIRCEYLPDFTKHCSLTKSHIYLSTIISYNIKFSSLDDVHLLANITFPAHIVSRRKHLKFDECQWLLYRQVQQHMKYCRQVLSMKGKQLFKLWLWRRSNA